MRHEFFIVDVFCTDNFSGNPLAVVVPDQELDTSRMQKIARWLGFSETTFLLPPTDPNADYRVRIFGPHGEFPFAGHPTLGTAYVWLSRRNGAADENHQASYFDVVQECEAGLVTVRQRGSSLSFAAPPLRRGGPLNSTQLQECLRATGLKAEQVVRHAWGDNGAGWRLIQVNDISALEDLSAHTVPRGVKIGVCALTPGRGAAYEIRALGPGYEDPVTGSLNAACAQWLRAEGVVPDSFHVRQGRFVGADGKLDIDCIGDTVWVGGQVRSSVIGSVDT
ncbi:PhzF family phenazine biosynthesis protein [Staphylococcus chromogenes]|nr:PhzF family phenazine biosynthesis protein [Staphylococcus chromogenes]